MNVGDIVRVTSPRYPDCAVEGILISINEYGWPVVSGIWNKEYEVSLEHFDVEVIRAVEPQEIGSIHRSYVKFSNTSKYGWIQINSKTMIPYIWEEIQ